MATWRGGTNDGGRGGPRGGERGGSTGEAGSDSAPPVDPGVEPGVVPEARRDAAAGRAGDAMLAWDAGGVRRLRRFLGASQAELAERLGTRQQTVSEWETGASRPRRMSRRLLHFVAETSGYYRTDGAADRDPDARGGTGAGGAP